MLQKEAIYVVAFHDEGLLSLFDFHGYSIKELAYEMISDIERYIDKWADFLLPNSLQEHKSCKVSIEQAISDLKRCIKP